MIIIAGHKDLDKKMLKRCVGYQEFAVIDATDGDEFEDWNVEKDNGFTPAGKLYREESDYFYTRAMNNKEEAIKNFFTSLDFITSMEKLISRYVEARGEINIFIILKQKAYKELGKLYQDQFLHYMGGDLSVVMLWDQIKDDNLQEVLTWVPDEKTLKACNKAVKRIEYDLSQNTAIARSKKKKKKDSLFDDDFDDDDDDDSGSYKDETKKWLKQARAAEDFLAQRDRYGNKLYVDPLDDIERLFPNLSIHLEDNPGIGQVVANGYKKKKKKKHKKEKLRNTLPWLDEEKSTKVKKNKHDDDGFYPIKFI